MEGVAPLHQLINYPTVVKIQGIEDLKFLPNYKVSYIAQHYPCMSIFKGKSLYYSLQIWPMSK